MPRSRRTLLFVIFLSANNVLVTSQISPGWVPTSTDQCVTPTLQPANLKPDLISAARNLLSSSQRSSLTEPILPPLISEPPDITISNPFQQVPVINPVQSISYKPSGVSPCPEILQVATMPTIPQPYTISPQIPEYPIGQICQHLDSMPLNEMPQSFSSPEALYTNNFASYPGLSQVYEPSLSIQPSAPTVTPFVSIARPVEAYGEYTPAVYPGTFNMQQVSEVPSLIEIPPVDFRSNIESTPAYQTVEQPRIVTSPASTPVLQDSSYKGSLPPLTPPNPVIIMEGSRSRWKSWLPILMIALCDGGCRHNDNGNCGCSIPIPYPIPIPTNNPIILGRGQKGKASSGSNDD